MNPLDLLQEFVSIPGAPGKEDAIRAAVAAHVDQIGLAHSTDAKGNLIVRLGTSESPKIVVTAHLDEIAMIVRKIEPDGRIRVGSLGGLFPWKAGEGPVLVQALHEDLNGVLSVGSIHTDHPQSPVTQAKANTLTWEMVHVFTGLSKAELVAQGVRPGTRVVIHPSRRTLITVGDHVAGHFLDDRADLVSWLLALAALKDSNLNVTFLATAAEEVGGEGALFYMAKHRPDICIALELGPKTPDSDIELTTAPTVWTSDAYATMMDADGDLIEAVAEEAGIEIQFQHLSRGGSDASCAAGKGLCARPMTLGLPMDNTHGYEIMHPGAMAELARLTVALVKRL